MADNEPTPALKDIWGAFMRTVFESVDSKKSSTGLIGAIAASLVLLAGRQGWTWLTPDLSNLIAGVIVTKGLAVIASHAVVDTAKAKAAGTVDAAVATATLAKPALLAPVDAGKATG